MLEILWSAAGAEHSAPWWSGLSRQRHRSLVLEMFVGWPQWPDLDDDGDPTGIFLIQRLVRGLMVGNADVVSNQPCVATKVRKHIEVWTEANTELRVHVTENSKHRLWHQKSQQVRVSRALFFAHLGGGHHI